MLLRKSNLVPDTQKEFNPERQLARKNICLAANAILVNIEWSKTLQYKEKVLPVPLIPIANKIICPVFWTWKLVQRIPARPLDPLFCYHRKGKFMTLTYPRLTYWFKKWIEECKLNPKVFTLHSFRNGGASFLHNADVPAQMIKLLGNWASEVYLRYIDITLSKRVEMVSKFSELLKD